MAAGQGFKTFTTGEVLTAGDVNGYLMQGINVFASEAARDAAITAPAEGQFAFTKDNNSLWYYTGSAWAASGATGDIEGVTAGVGISGGGTSGTVTITNSMATAIDAKGDLVPGTGADTFSRLAVGANGTVLTADSAEATGLKWATPATSAIKTCALYKSANQSISNNTLTAVTFNSEFFDTDSFHSTVTNTSRITVPTTGYYQVNGILTWRANTNAGDLYSYLKVNGSTNLATPWIESGQANDGATISISTIADLDANDYLELYVLQLTGISKDLWANSAQDCTFSVSYLGA